jgi:Type III restriction enzyme, res subunit
VFKASARVCFLVDLDTLVGQAVEEFASFGINAGILQKAKRPKPHQKIFVASIQTIGAKLKKEDIYDLLGDVRVFILDEAHDNCYRDAYEQIRAAYKGKSKFLGLTATPWRLSNKQSLSEKYQVTVNAPPTLELIKLGRIVPCRAFAIDGVIDVTSIDTDQMGEFASLQIEAQAIKKTSLDHCVNEWKRLGENRPTAAYCPSVKTAKSLCEAFASAGIPAEWQSGEMPTGKDGFLENTQGKATRKAQDYRLSTGITKVVCSVGTQKKGWNLPSLGCVIYYSATMSKAAFYQACGRGARTCKEVYWNSFPKADYVLLDFGGNLSRFGINPNNLGSDPMHYDISPKRTSSGEGFDNSKTCPNCKAICTVFTQICPECQHVFSQEKEYMESELPQLGHWFDETEKANYQSYRRLLRKAYEDDLQPESAAEEMLDETGCIPQPVYALHAVLGVNPTAESVAQYLEYLERHCGKDTIHFRAAYALEFGKSFHQEKRKKKR